MKLLKKLFTLFFTFLIILGSLGPVQLDSNAVENNSWHPVMLSVDLAFLAYDGSKVLYGTVTGDDEIRNEGALDFGLTSAGLLLPVNITAAARLAKSGQTIVKHGGKVYAKLTGQTAKQAEKKLANRPEKIAGKALEKTGKQSERFSKEKRALVDMAKKDKKKGISPDDMKAYKQLNKELKDPFPSNKVRGPEVHPNRPHGKEPHGHVGPIDHIPIKKGL